MIAKYTEEAGPSQPNQITLSLWITKPLKNAKYKYLISFWWVCNLINPLTPLHVNLLFVGLFMYNVMSYKSRLNAGTRNLWIMEVVHNRWYRWVSGVDSLYRPGIIKGATFSDFVSLIKFHFSFTQKQDVYDALKADNKLIIFVYENKTDTQSDLFL